MSKTTTIVTLAVLGLASFAFVGPAIAADSGAPCTDVPLVVAPPGATFSGLWGNDCIASAATSLVVTLQSADAIPHRFLFGSCLANNGGANVGPGASREYTIALVGSAVKIDGQFCNPADLQDRDGGLGSTGPQNGPVVVKNPDGSTTIHYICGVHRAAMHGTITLGA